MNRTLVRIHPHSVMKRNTRLLKRCKLPQHMSQLHNIATTIASKPQKRELIHPKNRRTCASADEANFATL